MTAVRLIFVPGLKPKPPPDVYRRQLLRVLLAGLARVRPQASRWLAERPECFSVVAWTYLFYGSHRGVELDLPGIEGLLRQPVPSAHDIREIDSLSRRLRRLAHLIGDAVPVLRRLVAEPAMHMMMLDADRYLSNRDGVATQIRGLVRGALERAWDANEKVLLLGHSLGSVIAYDTLWELTHGAEPARGGVDLFVTLGSPLGTQFVRRSLLGAAELGRNRYPSNVRRWVNFSAKGDMTALYPRLLPYFHEMVDLDLVESLEDRVDLENHYRGDLGLNVHESYGYLANPSVTTLIGDWLEAAD